MREGIAEPLDAEEAKTASLAGKLYSDAVEQAQEPPHSAGGATVGQFLRQKWQQVIKLPTAPQIVLLKGWSSSQRACRLRSSIEDADKTRGSALSCPCSPCSLERSGAQTHCMLRRGAGGKTCREPSTAATPLMR